MLGARKNVEATIIQIPSFGFLRLKQVLKVIPVSKSQWWVGVKSGEYPAAIKLSERMTVWCAEDILALVEKYKSLPKAA